MGLGGLLVLIIFLCIVLEVWPWLLAIAAVAVAVWLVARWSGACAAAQVYARAECEACAARADEQHRLALAGDPAGVYGEYPPPPDVIYL